MGWFIVGCSGKIHFHKKEKNELVSRGKWTKNVLSCGWKKSNNEKLWHQIHVTRTNKWNGTSFCLVSGLIFLHIVQIHKFPAHVMELYLVVNKKKHWVIPFATWAGIDDGHWRALELLVFEFLELDVADSGRSKDEQRCEVKLKLYSFNSRIALHQQ